MHKILIADDDINLAVTLRELLQSPGTICKLAYNGKTAYKLARSEHFDLIMLDIIMPGLKGTQIAEQLREDGSEAAIIFLTNMNTVADICHGLTNADGYICKPFSSLELKARVDAILKRPPETRPKAVEVANIKIDFGTMKVFSGKKSLQLRKKEFEIIAFLAQNQGRLVSRDRILNNLWSSLQEPYPGTVDVHVSNIRRKLQRAFGRSIIQTIHGCGYTISAAS